MVSANFKVKVNNVSDLFGDSPIDPDTFAKYPFVVVRAVNGEVWYYGAYETEERAKEVIELERMDNGFIVDGNSVEKEKEKEKIRYGNCNGSNPYDDSGWDGE